MNDNRAPSVKNLESVPFAKDKVFSQTFFKKLVGCRAKPYSLFMLVPTRAKRRLLGNFLQVKKVSQKLPISVKFIINYFFIFKLKLL